MITYFAKCWLLTLHYVVGGNQTGNAKRRDLSKHVLTNMPCLSPAPPDCVVLYWETTGAKQRTTLNAKTRKDSHRTTELAAHPRLIFGLTFAQTGDPIRKGGENKMCLCRFPNWQCAVCHTAHSQTSLTKLGWNKHQQHMPEPQKRYNIAWFPPPQAALGNHLKPWAPHKTTGFFGHIE